MKASTPRAESGPIQAVRKLALGYPEVEESIVCNKAAFKARNKGFVFLGMDDESYNVMLKLDASISEATRLAKAESWCRVGANGWVTAVFGHKQAPPPGLLERWIDESYRLLAPKQLVAMLAEGGTQSATGRVKNPSRKKSSAKKAR